MNQYSKIICLFILIAFYQYVLISNHSFGFEIPSYVQTNKINSLSTLQTNIMQALASQKIKWTITYTGNKKDITTLNVKKTIQNAIRSSEDFVHYNVDSYAMRILVPTVGNSSITITFAYRESIAQTKIVDDLVAKVVNDNHFDTINPDEAIKKMHDWVVLHFSYDTSLFRHTAYDGVKTGKTVCEGYSIMLYKLFKKAGFPAKIVEGYGRAQSHAWVLVKLNGNWYHIDATWDDPTPEIKGEISYLYFMLTDAQVKKSHKPATDIKYPMATQNYSDRLDDLFVKDKDNQQLYETIQGLIGNYYLSDVYTFRTAEDIRAMIQKTSPDTETIVSYRYIDGIMAKSDLRKALKLENRAASYFVDHFPRGTGTNDVIVKLTLESNTQK